MWCCAYSSQQTLCRFLVFGIQELPLRTATDRYRCRVLLYETDGFLVLARFLDALQRLCMYVKDP